MLETDPGTLRAFRINDCDVWAGVNLEDAIRNACRETGVPREEIYDESEGGGEVDPTGLVYVDELGPINFTTVGEILRNGLKRSMQVSSTEY
ncbi:MAG: hypothetical protein JWN86_711 [Planctomycetota bacterium]|jgi:hypothetical protein|nr:hypothetical protein [Planctomycetota bacterium]